MSTDSLQDPEQGDESLWPDQGKLANRWEANLEVRQHFRSVQNLLIWPNDNVGVISMKALAMNKTVIYDAVQVWSEASFEAKSPPIRWLKTEAGETIFQNCLICWDQTWTQ